MAKQLLEITEEGKIVRDEETIRALGARNKPAVVVGIFGEARSGKSYLSNQLLKKEGEDEEELNGFKVEGGSQMITKGIRIRVIPHPKKEEHDLILLDTEGFDHTDQELGNLPGIIFFILSRISSVMIYNVKGDISESSLSCLSRLTYLLEKEKAKSKHKRKLILAVRDFNAGEEGQKIDDDYLKEKLSIQGNDRLKFMKQNIVECYPKRKCFTFGIPSVDVERLQENNIEMRFKEKMKNLKDYIVEHIEPRTNSEGLFMTGRDIAKLIIQEAEVVKTKSDFNNVIMKEALTKYTETMAKDPEAKAGRTFAKAHQKSCSIAMTFYDDQHDGENRENRKGELKKLLEEEKKKHMYNLPFFACQAASLYDDPNLLLVPVATVGVCLAHLIRR